MIKCEVIERFNLKDFGKLKNIQRKGIDTIGTLYVEDTFECDEEMVKYLTGENPFKRAFVKVIEIIPEKVKEEPKKEIAKEVKEEKPKKKKASKK